MSAEIELDQEVENVKFNNAIHYYNDIIGVMAHFEVAKSDTDFDQTHSKYKNSVYANMILRHLVSGIQDFEAICEDRGKVL